MSLRSRVVARMIALALAGLVFAVVSPAAQAQYAVRGMVLKVDPPSRTFVVSHEKIDGFMDAMTMTFEVRDGKALAGVTPGAIVEFVLSVGADAAYAERVAVRRYESVEQDPLTARRLAVMKRAAGLAPRRLAPGETVPEFALTDQARQRVTLSGLRGKVVAMNFVYTRCALPQFCLRVTNDFGALRKRFAQELGRDLVLLTVTFDPERDTPEALAAYARRWKADASTWHFLTGTSAEVRRVSGLFGVDAFPDEGLMNHSVRTAIVDRRGRLAATVEGNTYTVAQLEDLVRLALRE